MAGILWPFFKEGSYDVLKKNCNTFSVLTDSFGKRFSTRKLTSNRILYMWQVRDRGLVHACRSGGILGGRGDCALFCLLGERLPIKYRTLEKVT